MASKTAPKSKKTRKPATKKAGRPAKNVVTRQLAATVAKLRREGSTWAEIDAEAGFHRSSTGWREALDEFGFDKFGRKDGKGKSEAKGWNSRDLDGVGKSNGKPAAKKSKTGGKKRLVKKTKATAKK